MRKHATRLFIVLFSLGILFLLFFHAQNPKYIGKILARGGQVTQVSFEPEYTNVYWKGLYGELADTDGRETITLSSASNTMKNIDLSLPDCFQTEVYASTGGEVELSLVEHAKPEDIDSFLGIDAENPYSATRMFTEQEHFNVAGRDLILYSTRTLGSGDGFVLGAMRHGSSIVMVTKPVEDGTGFDGSAVDYQLMLPVPEDNSVTYTFFNDPTDPCNRPPTAPSIGTISTYEDIAVSDTFYATDPDGDELSISYLPDVSGMSLSCDKENDSGRYTCVIGFDPVDKGSYHTNIHISDGYYDVSTKVDFEVGYCGDLDSGGDPKCQSRYESCSSCPQDCGPCSDNRDSFVMIANNSCIGEETQISTYVRYKQGDCRSAPEYIDGIATCGILRNADIYIYRLNDERWKYMTSLDTGDDATAAYVFEDQEYKLKGDRSGYYPSFLYLQPKECMDTSTDEGTKAPETQSAGNETEKEPSLEQPEPALGWRPSPRLILVADLTLLLGGALAVFFIHRRLS